MSSPEPFQIPLGITLRDDARFENFLSQGNELLCNTLGQASRGEGEQFLFLWGNRDSGCSHLLQAVCHASDSAGRTAVYLPLDEVLDMGPEVLDGMEHLDLVCLDNLHLIAGNKVWEEGLFHFFNRIRAENNRLLVSADRAPRQLGVNLPDLASRLSWGMVFQVHNLDDDGKVKALQMRANGRGFEITEEVARFLLHRASRSMADLFDLLDQLDSASLSAKRKVTIPFVKQVLNL
ncbi:DnaA regulatory inactivator Hda [Amphritea balenae]|uniref:DnaA regulatory inactivator Hda n=1 Tax=Amphritea balenae TaxID=452629 RepID=A0A3P1STP3_9GAMM|nr:DnaA regulatory inactivator Hda [Amphritea balenae]RRD00587.1 DnaA regulatory inactivator Hda [Amphritea balenae]GGK69551.1 DnaA regulatory inactivator Hda [Amphritea balenae]